MPSPPPISPKNNVFFRLLIPLTAAFVVTILALVAGIFSTSTAPVWEFLYQQGGIIIAVEVSAILGVIAIAMTIDRLQYLRALKRQIGNPTDGSDTSTRPAEGPSTTVPLPPTPESGSSQANGEPDSTRIDDDTPQAGRSTSDG